MEQSFHAFCVYRNPRLNFSNIARTPVALSVSWLKFEPRSQILFEKNYQKKLPML